MNEIAGIFFSNHGYKCFWTIEDFTRSRSSEGLVIKSSRFKVDMLFKSEWYIEIKTFDEYFEIILCRSKGVSFKNFVHFSMHLFSSDGWQIKKKGFSLFPVNSQGYGVKGLNYNSLLNETLTVCFHMWNDSTKGKNAQCVMTSEMLDEKEVLHFPFQKLPAIRPSDLTFPAFNDLERVPIVRTFTSFKKHAKNNCLVDDMSDKGIQTEVTVFLRTESKEFSAHKSILCKHSPVFNALFEQDKIENANNIIEVKDIDSETLSLLLQFLHSEQFEALNWNSVVKLFHAAVKYQIEQLRSKCISILKLKLTEENVCEAYLLADRYQENELISNALDYFCKHSEKVFGSSEWMRFIHNETEIASEVLCKISKKLVNSQNTVRSLFAA